MSGQLGNRYGDRDAKPLTNQSAPTTATPGYLGEVRFDTDGNRWELIGIVGGVYYWALPIECFPAVGTEYLAYFENGTPVYKIKVERTSPPTANVGITTQIGLSGVNKVLSQTGMQYNSASQTIVLPFGGTGAILVSYWTSITSGDIGIYMISSNTGYLNKPCVFVITYTKGV